LSECDFYATRFFNTKFGNIGTPRRELGLEKPVLSDLGSANIHGFLGL
jgi:hypothetical protein